MDGIFKNLKYNAEKLVKFGFVKTDGTYVYSTELQNTGFKLTVRIDGEGAITTQVKDPNFEEPYTLHLVPDASGGFVGQVKSAYGEILREIADKCFEPEVFKQNRTHEILNYIKRKYGDEPEFLWEKFAGNAICRRKDNRKWYAVFLSVSGKKLGLPTDEIFEIIDLRCETEKLQNLIDNKNYFAGYHMNKKHWISVIPNGEIFAETIFDLVDESYALASKK